MQRYFRHCMLKQVLASRYCEQIRDKAAFTSIHALIGLTCMPFGLKKDPGTIHRAIAILLTKVQWQFTLVYLDDIFIIFRTPDKQIGHGRQLLTLLHGAVVTLNLKKSKFSTNCIVFLYQIICPGHP